MPETNAELDAAIADARRFLDAVDENAPLGIPTSAIGSETVRTLVHAVERARDLFLNGAHIRTFVAGSADGDTESARPGLRVVPNGEPAGTYTRYWCFDCGRAPASRNVMCGHSSGRIMPIRTCKFCAGDIVLDPDNVVYIHLDAVGAWLPARRCPRGPQAATPTVDPLP